MAEVHLAKTLGLAGFEKLVAIKLIHPNFSLDEQFVEMLINEAKLTVQLQHVNIAQTFDLGRVGDTYYLTMEYVDGADLYQLLRRSSELGIPMPIPAAAHVAHEIAVGLDYAHRKRDRKGNHLGIVHRDISPQNVLISRAGEVKLVDFGIAKASQRAQETQVGVIKGKYYYMSPEQAWGERVDARTDIFSTGIVLYEMLAGQMLYYEDELHRLLDRVRKADISMPSNVRDGIPTELERITMQALRKRPEDRYQNAASFGKDLQRFLNSYARAHSATDVVEWVNTVLGKQGTDEVPAPRPPTVSGVAGVPALSPSEFKDDNSVIMDPRDAPTRATPRPPARTPASLSSTRVLNSDEEDDDDDPATVPMSRPEVAAAAEKIRRRFEEADQARRAEPVASAAGKGRPEPSALNLGSASTQLATVGEDRTTISANPYFGEHNADLDHTEISSPMTPAPWRGSPLGTHSGLEIEILGMTPIPGAVDAHGPTAAYPEIAVPPPQRARQSESPPLLSRARPESHPPHLQGVPSHPQGVPSHPQGVPSHPQGVPSQPPGNWSQPGMHPPQPQVSPRLQPDLQAQPEPASPLPAAMPSSGGVRRPRMVTEPSQLSAANLRPRRSRAWLWGIPVLLAAAAAIFFVQNQAAPVPRNHRIEITSSPSGATVTVDGTPLATRTPAYLDKAEAGRTYKVQVSATWDPLESTCRHASLSIL